jgi:hypothetical protein
MLQAPAPHDPMIVKLVEPASDPTGLADVLLGAAKVIGVWVLVAIALGAAMACVMYWYRSRSD